MKSKERVLTALARRTPDRVPVNYYGNDGIDRRLKEHFKTDDLAEALEIDFRSVGPRYIGEKLRADMGDIKVDYWGIRRRWVEHSSGGYWDYCDWPLTNASVEQIEAWPMPNPDDFDYSGIPAACDKVRDFCVTAGHAGLGDIINSCGMLRTMEQILVDLITDDEAGLRLIERRNNIQLEITRRTLDAGRGKIDLMCLGEDLGTQRGPTISLELFRRHIRPWIEKFVALAKAFKIPTMIHSCGSSSWAFDDFVEIGITCVETLQPEAANMAPAYLKKRWGDKLAFHGCISTAGPLAYGTPDEVAGNVRETLEIMMPGGGYILSPTHSIQDNSPTENVLAMYEAAKKFGKY
ncbi:MAG: hypothetical protein HZA50_17295 [Planctomycetes bacterium]|nr:hypothetical protein [Planctomycetota bacterium]